MLLGIFLLTISLICYTEICSGIKKIFYIFMSIHINTLVELNHIIVPDNYDMNIAKAIFLQQSTVISLHIKNRQIL